MIEEEEKILRKFIGNDGVLKLMEDDHLLLICQAMKAYRDIPILVETLKK